MPIHSKLTRPIRLRPARSPRSSAIVYPSNEPPPPDLTVRQIATDYAGKAFGEAFHLRCFDTIAVSFAVR